MALPSPTVIPEPAPSTPAAVRRSRLDVRTIAEASLLLDVTVLLVLVRTFLPIPGFQGVVRLVCPMPFVLLTLRRGPRAGITASVAAFVLLSTFIGPILATQALVFGGLGTLFAWASQRRVHPAPAILLGAVMYGLLYLLPPFIFSILVLRIDLGRTLHDVQRQAGQFLNGLGHVRLLGVRVGDNFVAALSSFGPGRALLDALHAAALALLTHPLATLVAVWAAYSLVNVWAYLIVSIELYHRLPDESCRNTRGERLDYFSIR